MNRYDYVLIDCPPNLGLLTQNGLEISDYYMIPTVTDALSTYGILQVVSTIHELATHRSLKVKCLGLVVTKFSTRSAVQRAGLLHLPTRFDDVFDKLKLPRAPIFNTRMPEANSTAQAMDFEETRTPNTFANKYGYGSSDGQPLHHYVRQLAAEFMQRV